MATAGIGPVAHGVVEGPIALVSGVFGMLSLLVGVFFVLRGLALLHQYRRSPMYYSLRKAMLFIVMGGILAGLLLLYLLTEEGYLRFLERY